MSVDALSWVFGLDLPPREKIIMLTLGNGAGEFSECRQTVSDLADRTGLSVSALEDALTQLEQMSLLIRHRTPNPDDALPFATFTLCMPGRKVRRGWE